MGCVGMGGVCVGGGGREEGVGDAGFVLFVAHLETLKWMWFVMVAEEHVFCVCFNVVFWRLVKNICARNGEASSHALSFFRHNLVSFLQESMMCFLFLFFIISSDEFNREGSRMILICRDLRSDVLDIFRNRRCHAESKKKTVIFFRLLLFFHLSIFFPSNHPLLFENVSSFFHHKIFFTTFSPSATEALHA